jgi:hypothetical protein
MNRSYLRSSIAVVAAVAVAQAVAPVPRSEAHHTSAHIQNPSPAAPLGPTTILSFPAGSLIIPMDSCYQRAQGVTDAELQATLTESLVDLPANTTRTLNSLKCQAQGDYGIIATYSLMMRLVRKGIPVYWAIKHGKRSFHSEDLVVVRNQKNPVKTWKPGANNQLTPFNQITTVSYRGAPFVISAVDADADGVLDTTEAMAEMNRVSGFGSGNSRYSDIDVHVSQVNFEAGIYRKIVDLPKLALVDVTDPATDLDGQSGTVSLQGSIVEAIMDDQAGAADDFEGSVFDWVSIDDVINGNVVSGSYDLAWVPAFAVKNTTNLLRLQQFMDGLADLADAGASVVFQEDAIGLAEGEQQNDGTYTAGSKVFMISGGGLISDGISSTWSGADEKVYGEDYSDPASQWGGHPWMSAGGGKSNWMPRLDTTYLPGTRRMAFSHHTTTDSSRRWDFATWRHKDNDVDNKGRIYYLGGDNWRKATATGFRILLNTVLTTLSTANDPVTEVSRSSPVVAIVGGLETQYQGTFETAYTGDAAPTYAGSADANKFSYPFVTGHVRGYNLSLLASGETSIRDAQNVAGAVLFDAANGIPPATTTNAGCAFPATTSCRRVFTNTGSSSNPTRTLIVKGEVAALKPAIGPTMNNNEVSFLIDRINAGFKTGDSWVPKLGGVDRSTMAVIEPSPVIPNGRPTMLYVGGQDGMLHAVCASTTPTYCPSVGTELWAFLPRTELSKVRTNTTRLDGSPKVADVFGTFPDGRGFRTVLTFQTGNRYDAAIYALDITNPSDPKLLWELVTPGPGLNLAMGWVAKDGAVEPWTFAQTSMGTNQPGFEVRAIHTVTGAVQWTSTHAYPAPRDELNDPPPTTGIPGGVTIVANEARSLAQALLVPSLWGAVYKLDPLTGANPLGADSNGVAVPVVKFGNEDYHPVGASVALYRTPDIDTTGSTLRGLLVTGGFADPFAPSGTVWAPDDVNQFALGFPVFDDDNSPYVFNPASAGTWTGGMVLDFGAGQRAFSPAEVAGGEVFITTDTENVNAADYGSGGDSGTLWRRTLAAVGSATTIAIPSGAASVDISLTSGSVVAGGFSSLVRYNPPSFNTEGIGTEVIAKTVSFRRMWLRMF